MKSATQLTVGIPVFNAMPYLPECMESILGQTFSDFTILAINDGSTDNSLQYLNSIRDPRLRVLSQSNRGLTATLNRMLDEVHTPWLVRLDADDVAYPDRLERILAYLHQYPDAGMFYSLADYYPSQSFGKFRSTQGTPAKIRELVRSGYLPSICHPTVTLNVQKTKNEGGYRFNLHVEDIDLWWRMALQYDIQLIPETSIGFRQHAQSVSSFNLETQALNTLYIQYLLLSHLGKRTPLGYTEAYRALAGLYSPSQLKFKTHSRASNIAFGRRNILSGLWQAGRAFFSSPHHFARRFYDELIPNRMLCLGEPPHSFARIESLLWPAGPPSDEQSAIRPRKSPGIARGPVPPHKAERMI